MKTLLWLFLLLQGCMTLSRTQGAKTLEPGQIEAGMGMGGPVLRDPLWRLPVPQGPLLLRVGLEPDLDLGFRGYLLGGGVDLRWRFAQPGRWHLAVDPGMGFILQPSLRDIADLGGFETALPVVAEHELTPWLSWSASAQVVYRSRLNLGVGGAVWRFDAYGGVGSRLELHRGVLVLGLYGDLLTAPTRYGGLPTWSAGLDVKLRTLTREQARQRKERRAQP